MFKLKPKYFFCKIENIKPNLIEQYNIILFDLDNTLVMPETTNTILEIQKWIDKLPKKKSYIVSNSNTISERKKEIEEKFKIKVFQNKWKKPNPLLCIEINRKFNLKNKKVLFIGDRILTDILFGNYCNFDTILIQERFNDKKIKSFIENWLIKILNIKKTN